MEISYSRRLPADDDVLKCPQWLSTGNEKRDTLRYVLMLVETATVDRGWKIVIPTRTCDICQLEGRVVVIDTRTHVELWAKSALERRCGDQRI